MIIYFEFVDELTKLIFSVWLAVCDRKWYHNPTKADIFFLCHIEVCRMVIFVSHTILVSNIVFVLPRDKLHISV